VPWKKRLKQWLVRQFLSSRSRARPARDVTEAVTVAVFEFGIVFVLGLEGVKRPVVDCVFDGDHVLAERVPMDVVRARAGHQFVSHVVDGHDVLVVCRVLVALVGYFDEPGGIDVESDLFGLCAFLSVSSASRAAVCFVLMVF
jgi:hypothetical protein